MLLEYIISSATIVLLVNSLNSIEILYQLYCILNTIKYIKIDLELASGQLYLRSLFCGKTVVCPGRLATVHTYSIKVNRCLETANEKKIQDDTFALDFKEYLIIAFLPSGVYNSKSDWPVYWKLITNSPAAL